MSNEERRRDCDGNLYTKAQFFEFYHSDANWEKAGEEQSGNDEEAREPSPPAFGFQSPGTFQFKLSTGNSTAPTSFPMFNVAGDANSIFQPAPIAEVKWPSATTAPMKTYDFPIAQAASPAAATPSKPTTDEDGEADNKPTEIAPPDLTKTDWVCSSCGVGKDLQGDHLKTKQSVNSQCNSKKCNFKKRTFVRKGSPEDPSVARAEAKKEETSNVVPKQEEEPKKKGGLFSGITTTFDAGPAAAAATGATSAPNASNPFVSPTTLGEGSMTLPAPDDVDWLCFRCGKKLENEPGDKWLLSVIDKCTTCGVQSTFLWTKRSSSAKQSPILAGPAPSNMFSNNCSSASTGSSSSGFTFSSTVVGFGSSSSAPAVGGFASSSTSAATSKPFFGAAATPANSCTAQPANTSAQVPANPPARLISNGLGTSSTSSSTSGFSFGTLGATSTSAPACTPGTTSTSAPAFSFGTPGTTSTAAPAFSFGTPGSTSTSAPACTPGTTSTSAPAFSFGTPGTTATSAPAFSFGTPGSTSTSAPACTPGTTSTSAPAFSFGTPGSTSTPAPAFGGFGASSSVSTAPLFGGFDASQGPQKPKPETKPFAGFCTPSTTAGFAFGVSSSSSAPAFGGPVGTTSLAPAFGGFGGTAQTANSSGTGARAISFGSGGGFSFGTLQTSTDVSSTPASGGFETPAQSSSGFGNAATSTPAKTEAKANGGGVKKPPKSNSSVAAPDGAYEPGVEGEWLCTWCKNKKEMKNPERLKGKVSIFSDCKTCEASTAFKWTPSGGAKSKPGLPAKPACGAQAAPAPAPAKTHTHNTNLDKPGIKPVAEPGFGGNAVSSSSTSVFGGFGSTASSTPAKAEEAKTDAKANGDSKLEGKKGTYEGTSPPAFGFQSPATFEFKLPTSKPATDEDDEDDEADNKPTEIAPPDLTKTDWVCSSCGVGKDLQGDHLKTKQSVNSQCNSKKCNFKKRTFVRKGSPEDPSVAKVEAKKEETSNVVPKQEEEPKKKGGLFSGITTTFDAGPAPKTFDAAAASQFNHASNPFASNSSALGTGAPSWGSADSNPFTAWGGPSPNTSTSFPASNRSAADNPFANHSSNSSTPNPFASSPSAADNPFSGTSTHSWGATGATNPFSTGVGSFSTVVKTHTSLGQAPAAGFGFAGAVETARPQSTRSASEGQFMTPEHSMVEEGEEGSFSNSSDWEEVEEWDAEEDEEDEEGEEEEREGAEGFEEGVQVSCTGYATPRVLDSPDAESSNLGTASALPPDAASPPAFKFESIPFGFKLPSGQPVDSSEAPFFHCTGDNPAAFADWPMQPRHEEPSAASGGQFPPAAPANVPGPFTDALKVSLGLEHPRLPADFDAAQRRKYLDPAQVVVTAHPSMAEVVKEVESEWVCTVCKRVKVIKGAQGLLGLKRVDWCGEGFSGCLQATEFSWVKTRHVPAFALTAPRSSAQWKGSAESNKTEKEATTNNKIAALEKENTELRQNVKSLTQTVATLVSKLDATNTLVNQLEIQVAMINEKLAAAPKNEPHAPAFGDFNVPKQPFVFSNTPQFFAGPPR